MATDLSVRTEQSNVMKTYRRTSAPGSPQGDGAEIKEETQQQPGQKCAGEAEIRAIGRSGGVEAFLCPQCRWGRSLP